MADEKKTAEQDDTKTTPAPESTWGATPEAKAAWASKHGKAEKEDK